jgi:outer membrane protein assembly factor BamE (lipoprotein component of BamABCDE complex)
LLLGICSGCLVASDTHQTRSGTYVAPSTLQQIHPQQTTQDWVQKVMGNPTGKDVLADNSEIWRYSYSEKTTSSGAVFLVFAGSDVKETGGTIFVQFKDGVVTNYWKG